MFKIVKIQEIEDGLLDEESLVVEDAFFFTIPTTTYYRIYNKKIEVIGTVPIDYNMFFRVDNSPVFEDIDLENLLRLFDRGEHFSLVGTKEGKKDVILIDSSDIARFELIEDDDLQIPFTSNAFDSDGIVIFKNMMALSDTLEQLR